MLLEHDRVFIAQMVEAATAALDFTDGLSRETVCSDRLIGLCCGPRYPAHRASARNVSDEVRAGNPDIPWRQMSGMRNVVVHDYADVDLSLV